MTKTLEELRAEHAESARQLAEAEAVEANREPISVDEASRIYADAIERHRAAQTRDEKHQIALEGLAALERGKHKGQEVDVLAQLVIDAREAGEKA